MFAWGEIVAKEGPIGIELEIEIEMLSQRRDYPRESTIRYLYLDCTPVYTAADVTRLKMAHGGHGLE